MTWCPNPKCGRVIEKHEYTLESTVRCLCEKEYCFFCLGEEHAPSSCKHVEMWALKEKNDGENV